MKKVQTQNKFKRGNRLQNGKADLNSKNTQQQQVAKATVLPLPQKPLDALDYRIDPIPPAQCPNHTFIYIKPTIFRVVEKCPPPTVSLIERSFKPRDSLMADLHVGRSMGEAPVEKVDKRKGRKMVRTKHSPDQ